MTPEQVTAAVRDELEKIFRLTANMSILKHIRTALAILDDAEGEEEWTAEVDGAGYWWVCLNGVRWLAIKDEATTHRIARLPKLERAAREVCRQRTAGNVSTHHCLAAESFDALWAALGEPQ